MSLRINTNVSAMTAMRQLTINEGRLQGSINRLSTGLKINNAADDPAGMVVSESMRSQIKGIEQAIQNTQNAVNMTKTAEGSLDEVSRLLLSMRAIAVSSANTAVVNNTQLQANQNEVRSIVDSLNRIANQTSWGDRKLLNGASGTVTNITETNLVTSSYLGSEIDGQIVRSGDISMTRTQQATRSTATLANAYPSSTTAVNQGTFAINGVAINSGPGETVDSLMSKINSVSNLTNVSATFNGSNVVLTSTKFGSNFPIQYSETASILNGGSSTNGTTGVDAIFTVTAPVEPDPSTATEVFTGGSGAGVSGLVLRSPTGNTMTLTAAGNNNAGPTTIGSVSVGAVRFQIGANASQFTSFSLPSVFANDLGTNSFAGESIDTIDVTSENGSTRAISIIDEAINQIASIRGQLGSFQSNFLESNVRSLGVTQENMVATESMIRDADIAVEMTEYTKLQILRESGLSVLAQASRSPQSVLSLLQGG